MLNVRLNIINCRRYKVFNAKCCAQITGRSYASEMSEPSFDILAWIRWRRTAWLGKGLRGEKGDAVLTMLYWDCQHRRAGDIFSHIPLHMKTSFQVLQSYALNKVVWNEYCNEIKLDNWVWYNRYSTRSAPPC